MLSTSVALVLQVASQDLKLSVSWHSDIQRHTRAKLFNLIMCQSHGTSFVIPLCFIQAITLSDSGPAISWGTHSSAYLNPLTHFLWIRGRVILLRNNGLSKTCAVAPKRRWFREYIYPSVPISPAQQRDCLQHRRTMKMQMLVVVAVAALVSSLSEGRILTKCELKRQLEAAALQLPEKAKEKVSEEDFIAKSESCVWFKCLMHNSERLAGR